VPGPAGGLKSVVRRPPRGPVDDDECGESGGGSPARGALRAALVLCHAHAPLFVCLLVGVGGLVRRK